MTQLTLDEGGSAMKIDTILVPLDGSRVAEAALTPAVDLAREVHARVVLLRATEAHTLPMADPVESQVAVMNEAQEYLAAARDRVVAAGVADIEVSVWYGAPVERGSWPLSRCRPHRHVEPWPQRGGAARDGQRHRTRTPGDHGPDPGNPPGWYPARGALGRIGDHEGGGPCIATSVCWSRSTARRPARP
jgi:hypothetical protein